MTIEDMRWLWVYYQDSPDSPIPGQVEKMLEGTGAKREGSGTEIEIKWRDIAFILPDAEGAFAAARKLTLSNIPLKRVRLAGYAHTSDPDFRDLSVSLEFKTAEQIDATAAVVTEALTQPAA